MASCSVPNSAASTLFPYESEKYMEETIFSRGTISWYSTAFQHSCPSGILMHRRDFPPTRTSMRQTGAVKPFGPHSIVPMLRKRGEEWGTPRRDDADEIKTLGTRQFTPL